MDLHAAQLFQMNLPIANISIPVVTIKEVGRKITVKFPSHALAKKSDRGQTIQR